MATLTTTQTSPSLLGGVVIIGGTIIGAGMFSLPVVMSGAWFFWSMAALIFTWFCMLQYRLIQPQLLPDLRDGRFVRFRPGHNTRGVTRRHL